jgi:uncharacterized membrane protein YeiH
MAADPLSVSSVTLPLAVDLFAVFFFSLTGSMEAIRRHYDFVGVIVLAIACGLGGSLLRDGLFIQDGPPAAMRNGFYIVAVMGGCLIAGLFFKHVERLSKPFLIFDALGTGAYGVVGAGKAFAAGLSIPASIFVGVVNAVGSGLIRDVLVREEPLMLKPGQFYVIASLAGVSGFALFRAVFDLPLVISAIAAIGITFLLRMLAIWFNWRTRPILPPSRPPEDFPGEGA